MPENQAIAELQTILSRPEYRFEQSVPWWQQLLAPILDYAWSVLSQLIQLVLDSAAGREGSIGIAVVLVCVLVVAAALVYLGRALRLSVVRESELRSASLAERRERSDQLWQTAHQMATAGHFAEAVRLLYLSVLYALDEHALLHVERSLTNREHAHRLRQDYPGLATTFTDIVDRYERVRYGRALVTADAFAELSGRAEHVRAAALKGAPA
jgi:hypothetical protein